MKASELVKKFKKDNYGTVSAKELADNFGVRIRPVKGTEDTFEVSSSYFYTSQESTAHIVEALNKFALDYEMNVTMISTFVSFDSKPWPKTSWASVDVRIS